jgi:hypothetical protein
LAGYRLARRQLGIAIDLKEAVKKYRGGTLGKSQNMLLFA